MEHWKGGALKITFYVDFSSFCGFVFQNNAKKN